MKPAVFLDRDGVVVESVLQNGCAKAPLSLEKFRLVEDARGQVKRLKEAGFLNIVVTNQPEIATGELKLEVLEEMNRQLRRELAIDDIYCCPHHQSEGCPCHKPVPGLLLQAIQKWGIDPKRSFLIGDRWRDIGAGKAVGSYTILIKRDYSGCDSANANVSNLTEAVDIIMRKAGS